MVAGRNLGRVGDADQALAVPAEPVARLGPSGFDPSRILELAELCEASVGRDRDLDREIWLTVVADDAQRELVRIGRELHGDDEAVFRIDRLMDGLAYTASLDAAMTLVPEGLDYGCGRGIDTELGPNKAICHAWVGEGEGDLVFAETVALALCAAALRARASNPTPPSDGDEK